MSWDGGCDRIAELHIKWGIQNMGIPNVGIPSFAIGTLGNPRGLVVRLLDKPSCVGHEDKYYFHYSRTWSNPCPPKTMPLAHHMIYRNIEGYMPLCHGLRSRV